MVLRDGLLRYGELNRVVVGITPKMLTQTLKEQEADELITRKVYFEVSPKVEYSLTETGKELIPFISQMMEKVILCKWLKKFKFEMEQLLVVMEYTDIYTYGLERYFLRSRVFLQ
jgi:DNA-binding HxlR family transcriptional regulator